MNLKEKQELWGKICAILETKEFQEQFAKEIVDAMLKGIPDIKDVKIGDKVYYETNQTTP